MASIKEGVMGLAGYETKKVWTEGGAYLVVFALIKRRQKSKKDCLSSSMPWKIST
jgi:hypothetical protein